MIHSLKENNSVLNIRYPFFYIINTFCFRLVCIDLNMLDIILITKSLLRNFNITESVSSTSNAYKCLGAKDISYLPLWARHYTACWGNGVFESFTEFLQCEEIFISLLSLSNRKDISQKHNQWWLIVLFWLKKIFWLLSLLWLPPPRWSFSIKVR